MYVQVFVLLCIITIKILKIGTPTTFSIIAENVVIHPIDVAEMTDSGNPDQTL